MKKRKTVKSQVWNHDKDSETQLEIRAIQAVSRDSIIILNSIKQLYCTPEQLSLQVLWVREWELRVNIEELILMEREKRSSRGWRYKLAKLVSYEGCGSWVYTIGRASCGGTGKSDDQKRGLWLTYAIAGQSKKGESCQWVKKRYEIVDW